MSKTKQEGENKDGNIGDHLEDSHAIAVGDSHFVREDSTGNEWIASIGVKLMCLVEEDESFSQVLAFLYIYETVHLYVYHRTHSYGVQLSVASHRVQSSLPSLNCYSTSKKGGGKIAALSLHKEDTVLTVEASSLLCYWLTAVSPFSVMQDNGAR